jgi:hypothetical protein
MSYTKRNPQPRVALGDTWDTVKSMSGAVDPYLPEALCRIDQIRALRQGRSPLQALFGKAPTVPVPTCATIQDGLPGIGVEKAIKPLRAAAYLYRNPAVVWLGLTVALSIPFALGIMVGRSK